MKNTLFSEIVESVGRYVVSTSGAVFSGLHWNLWEPLFIQCFFLGLDIARQRYIKKDRQKDLEATRQEIHNEIQETAETLKKEN